MLCAVVSRVLRADARCHTAPHDTPTLPCRPALPHSQAPRSGENNILSLADECRVGGGRGRSVRFVCLFEEPGMRTKPHASPIFLPSPTPSHSHVLVWYPLGLHILALLVCRGGWVGGWALGSACVFFVHPPSTRHFLSSTPCALTGHAPLPSPLCPCAGHGHSHGGAPCSGHGDEEEEEGDHGHSHAGGGHGHSHGSSSPKKKVCGRHPSLAWAGVWKRSEPSMGGCGVHWGEWRR